MEVEYDLLIGRMCSSTSTYYKPVVFRFHDCFRRHVDNVPDVVEDVGLELVHEDSFSLFQFRSCHLVEVVIVLWRSSWPTM